MVVRTIVTGLLTTATRSVSGARLFIHGVNIFTDSQSLIPGMVAVVTKQPGRPLFVYAQNLIRHRALMFPNSLGNPTFMCRLNESDALVNADTSETGTILRPTSSTSPVAWGVDLQMRVNPLLVVTEPALSTFCQVAPITPSSFPCSYTPQPTGHAVCHTARHGRNTYFFASQNDMLKIGVTVPNASLGGASLPFAGIAYAAGTNFSLQVYLALVEPPRDGDEGERQARWQTAGLQPGVTAPPSAAGLTPTIVLNFPFTRPTGASGMVYANAAGMQVNTLDQAEYMYPTQGVYRFPDAGYYGVMVTRVGFSLGTTTLSTYTGSAVYLQNLALLVSLADDAYGWREVLPTDVFRDPTVGQAARLSAASFLSSNITTEADRGGRIKCRRIRDSSFYSVATSLARVEGVDSLTTPTLYMETGAYTWMRMGSRADQYRSCVSSLNGLEFDLTSDADQHVLIYCPITALTAVGTYAAEQTFTYELVGHYEFQTDSVIYGTPARLLTDPDELEDAVRLLRDTPEFLENPSHLETIWNTIKSAARKGLRYAELAAPIAGVAAPQHADAISALVSALKALQGGTDRR